MAEKRKITSAAYDKRLTEETSSNDLRIKNLNEELNSLNSIFDMRKKILLKEELINLNQDKIIKQKNLILKLDEEGRKVSTQKLNSINAQIKSQRDLVKLSERKLMVNKLLINSIDVITKSMLLTNGTMRTYLMESDAAIKNINLELGLSGDRAMILRDNFEDSAVFAARMGINVEGVAKMIQIYSEETGRARIHNEANLKSMTLIAKGTGLGIEGAAQMAGQYEMMGFNATDTANEVQRILDTSERMGVNTTKVLKSINTNFKELQKYTFKNGSKGIADMAIYSEKFKINMKSAMSSMDNNRNLDDVIKTSAQLQVLGGEFARLADPMAMLFESRNDPKAYLKRITEMTKGMFTLRKTVEGFNFEIVSPMARDQLAAAAKALGMTTDELTQQSQRMREIQQTRSQMFNKGFTNEEKDIIENLAKFDTTTGKMMVKVGEASMEVSDLNDNHLKMLIQQKSSLEERALASQTFDDAFKNTINELKATLLPILKGINNVLLAVRPIANSIMNFFSGGAKSELGKTFLEGVGMLAGIAMLISPIYLGIKSLVTSKLATSILSGSNPITDKTETPIKKGKTMSGAKMMKRGAGVGMAAVGIGAGVGMAAVGISQLADSMGKLNKDQANTLKNIAITLAITFPLAAVGLAAFTTVGTLAIKPLLAIGAAMLGIGAGVGIATAGIGSMAEGISKLDKVDLSGVGKGLFNIGAAGIALGSSIFGFGAMSLAVSSIASNANDIERIGGAFYNIGAVLKGSKEDFNNVKEMINSISSSKININSGFGQLVDLLSKPLKVEFSDKEIGFVANIDLSVGGSSFYEELEKKLVATRVKLQKG